MATVLGTCQKYFWSSRLVSRIEGAPFCVKKCERFEKIINEFTYNHDLPLLFVGNFWEARQMIQDLKDHTK